MVNGKSPAALVTLDYSRQARERGRQTLETLEINARERKMKKKSIKPGPCLTDGGPLTGCALGG